MNKSKIIIKVAGLTAGLCITGLSFSELICKTSIKLSSCDFYNNFKFAYSKIVKSQSLISQYDGKNTLESSLSENNDIASSCYKDKKESAISRMILPNSQEKLGNTIEKNVKVNTTSIRWF